MPILLKVSGGLPPVHNRKYVGQLWDITSAVLYKSTVACCMKLAEQTHGVFTPVLFNLIEFNSSSFPPLVRIFWAGVNTAIALGCGPNNRTETQLKRRSRSGSKQTLVWCNGWTNEWMTLSTLVVLFTVSVWLAKRAVWKRTAPNQTKSALCLVWTKASELADFPGVNTPSEFQSRFRVDKTKQIKPG